MTLCPPYSLPNFTRLVQCSQLLELTWPHICMSVSAPRPGAGLRSLACWSFYFQCLPMLFDRGRQWMQHCKLTKYSNVILSYLRFKPPSVENYVWPCCIMVFFMYWKTYHYQNKNYMSWRRSFGSAIHQWQPWMNSDTCRLLKQIRGTNPDSLWVWGLMFLRREGKAKVALLMHQLVQLVLPLSSESVCSKRASLNDSMMKLVAAQCSQLI